MAEIGDKRDSFASAAERTVSSAGLEDQITRLGSIRSLPVTMRAESSRSSTI